MEGIIDTQHGTSVLLASIVVVLCVHLIFRIGEFVFEMQKKRNEVSEDSIRNLTAALQVNTAAVEKLQGRMNEMDQKLADIPKFKQDLRRAFTALKYLAGNEWNDVRNEMFSEGDL